ADGEDSRKACLEKERCSMEAPAHRVSLLATDVGSSLDESLLVQSQTPLEPVGARDRARHQEEVADGVSRHLTAGRALPRHLLQMLFTFQGDDLRSRAEGNLRVFL